MNPQESGSDATKLDLQRGAIREDSNGQASPTAASKQEWERRFAMAIGENIAWLEASEAELLRLHPDWDGQYVAVASRTPSKILAVSPERHVAFEEGMKSPELLDLAHREGMPPGCLLNAMLLGSSWIFTDF